MRAVDTNVLVRLITRDDPRQTDSAEGFIRAGACFKPALGFSDCLMLHLARKAGHLPLGTFDRNLSKVDGAQKL
jgi:predicted nucleic acid-binding protein